MKIGQKSQIEAYMQLLAFENRFDEVGNPSHIL